MSAHGFGNPFNPFPAGAAGNATNNNPTAQVPPAAAGGGPAAGNNPFAMPMGGGAAQAAAGGGFQYYPTAGGATFPAAAAAAGGGGGAFGGGVGGTAAPFGAVPPNWTNVPGVGMGFQPVGNVGGGAGATGGGFTMPAGMPPPVGPFQMPNIPPTGGMPPMGGTVPGLNFAGGPAPGVPGVPTLPAPNNECGRLGQVCYAAGPREASAVNQELATTVRTQNAAGFDRPQYVQDVCSAPGIVVFLTMSPSTHRVLPVFGIHRVSGIGAGASSLLANRYMGFIGNGEMDPRQSLQIMAPSAVSNLGTWVTEHANSEAFLELYYQCHPAMGLLPAPQPPTTPNDPVVSQVTYPHLQECPNALVHVFSDSPHPYVALKRLKWIEDNMGTTVMDFLGLKWWLRASCHESTPGGRSRTVQDWEPQLALGDDTIMLNATRRHNMMMPPPQRAPAPAGMSAAEMELKMLRLMQENEDRKKAKDKPKDGKVRDMPDKVYRRYLIAGGLNPNTPRDQAPGFVKEWEETANTESAFRNLIVERVARSVKALNMPNRVAYYRAGLVNSIRLMDVGQTLDLSHGLSHLGFSNAALFYLFGSSEQAAMWQSEDEQFDMADVHTVDDVKKHQGSPGKGPATIDELIDSVETYLVNSHAIFTLQGPHYSEARDSGWVAPSSSIRSPPNPIVMRSESNSMPPSTQHSKKRRNCCPNCEATSSLGNREMEQEYTLTTSRQQFASLPSITLPPVLSTIVSSPHFAIQNCRTCLSARRSNCCPDW